MHKLLLSKITLSTMYCSILKLVKCTFSNFFHNLSLKTKIFDIFKNLYHFKLIFFTHILLGMPHKLKLLLMMNSSPSILIFDPLSVAEINSQVNFAQDT